MMPRLILGLAAVLMLGIICLRGVSAQETFTGPLTQAERTIPFKKQPDVHTGNIYRVIFVTLLAIGLAAGSTWMLRKYLQKKGLVKPAADSRVAVKETRRISPRLTLYLVQIDGQEYLIAQSGDKTAMIKHKTIEDK